jgi:diguanylate cyclase (GGDEF)-like protein/PAS domain S-box-containing protein
MSRMLLQPENDRQGGATVMHLDITGRKLVGERLAQSNEDLIMLVQGVKDYAVIMLDTNGRVTTWNDGAERLKGYSADEILGKHFSTFYTTDAIARDRPNQELKIAVDEGRFEEEGLRVRKDGSQFWANVVISALHDETGQLRGFAKVTRDINDRKQAESKALLLAERLSLATAVAKVGVWDWELATDVHTWDATMFAIYGFLPTDLINYQRWSSSVHPNDLPRVQATLLKAIDVKGDGSSEFRIILTDGTIRNISAVFSAVLDGLANVIRVTGVNVDISERKQSEEALRNSEARMTYLAGHDFLTGLPNRMLLNERIGRAIKIARRNGRQAALLFLDLDGLKQINDSLGHPIGDKLIQSVGKRLVDSVRASDTVCRHSDDEFVVLLSEVKHPEDTAIAARRMLKAVARVHSIDQHDLHITGCIGISVYPVDGMDAETLIKNADTAMYQAKENGRPSYQFFNPAMTAKAVERQFIEENLRHALDRQELALHYQPKINLKTGAITGAEALLRWNHPTRGFISPAQFIHVAEETGLILPIGNWVLREACTQAYDWMEAGLSEMTMAVNVSALQFQSGDFAEGLFAILLDTGLDPKLLELEVTESLLMRRPESTALILQTLREKGVNVAIDDFGTGYSSLSYLYKLPLDSLKIDQSFVRQITATPNQTGIVSAIIDMGKNLTLRVVAEGVETAEELDFLQSRHCDEAQGYYFSRPVPPHQFVKLFEGTHAWNKSVTSVAVGRCDT